MKLENEFKQWLECHYPANTAGSRMTNCKNVEKSYGDLGVHLEKDRCSKIIFDLTYSTDDEREHRKAKHPVPIDGNIRNGSATLKQAVGLYVKFRDDYKNGHSLENSQEENSNPNTKKINAQKSPLLRIS
ncbi:hypothetical protein EZS27_015792 [termite gut metagenome]|uniref:Uncharacterized protein n=1 Tax=termite gut metagenome TaxID=433724 RepID=A0A5J4RQ13_9ZZZZ